MRNTSTRRKWLMFGILPMLLVICLSGCSTGLFEEFDDTPYTGEINIKLPEAPGTDTYEKYGVSFDVSNQSEGYFAVSCSGRDKKLKMRVLTPLEHTYDYDVNNEGIYEFFPFSEGDGSYNITLYEQREGNTYSVVYGITLVVEMVDDRECFVYPNQRVDYDAACDAVYLSFQLTQKYETDQEKIDVLFRYVSSQIDYDNDFAARVMAGEISSGYIPDPDITLETHKGVCYDYSVLLATMLRAQNIPTKLVVGYVTQDGQTIAHAWNYIWIDGLWVLYDSTLYDTGSTAGDYVDLYYY